MVACRRKCLRAPLGLLLCTMLWAQQSHELVAYAAAAAQAVLWHRQHPLQPLLPSNPQRARPQPRRWSALWSSSIPMPAWALTTLPSEPSGCAIDAVLLDDEACDSWQQYPDACLGFDHFAFRTFGVRRCCCCCIVLVVQCACCCGCWEQCLLPLNDTSACPNKHAPFSIKPLASFDSKCSGGGSGHCIRSAAVHRFRLHAARCI